MYVCVPYIASGVIFDYMFGLMIFAAFQFCFIALAVNVFDSHGHSNKMRPQLQPKKTKVVLY